MGRRRRAHSGPSYLYREGLGRQSGELGRRQDARRDGFGQKSVSSVSTILSLLLALDTNISLSFITDKTSFEIAPKVETQDISLKSDVQFSSLEALAPICPGGTHTKVDVHFTSDGSLKVKAGIVITGSVVPPAITKLAAFGGALSD